MISLKQWPNFFIVGAPRSGTTSLYAYLNQIPGIYMSPVKEPEFFSPNRSTNNGLIPIVNKSDYLTLFKNVKDELVIGEASTCYLEDPDSPKLIHNEVTDALIIILLRDPIERAYSHYLIQRRNNLEKKSFHESIKNILKKYDPLTSNHYLHAGLYSEQILRYINSFGEKNVKIIIFEDFVQNERNTVKDILSFLGVNFEPNFDSDVQHVFNLPKEKFANKILHSKTIRKIAGKIIPTASRQLLKEKLLLQTEKPLMTEEDRKILRNFFDEDVKKLKNILGQDLPWKNF